MKKRIGVILIASGCILLLNPQLDLDTLRNSVTGWLTSYWPVVMIGLGVLLQQTGNKKTKRSQR